jgi:hypothetical protein
MRDALEGRRVLSVVIGAAAVIAVVAGAAHTRAPEFLDAPPATSAHATAHAVPRRETRPTLDPAGFTGEVAAAYRVAREIPDVLDQLHCHCNCHSQYGHASLLSCYTDGHAST